jgi:hypothetical protein
MRESSLLVRSNASEEREAQGTRPNQLGLPIRSRLVGRYTGILLRAKCWAR